MGACARLCVCQNERERERERERETVCGIDFRCIRGYRYSRKLVNIVMAKANIPRVSIEEQMGIFQGENNQVILLYTWD